MTEHSTEVIAGQRLMVGFDGTDFNDNLKFLIGTLQVGGLILFSRNLGNRSRSGSCAVTARIRR
jgi:beta-N-acetylhexosaminidase